MEYCQYSDQHIHITCTNVRLVKFVDDQDYTLTRSLLKYKFVESSTVSFHLLHITELVLKLFGVSLDQHHISNTYMLLVNPSLQGGGGNFDQRITCDVLLLT